MFHPIEIIQRKRDGHSLSDAEIQAFVHALVHRTPEQPTPTDAQTAALLMAVLLRGLHPAELAALTQAMRFSGETLDTSSLPGFVVDKHSTGGVGDKSSLLIAPIVAAAGLYDPMISGRSLGHTGGTLDKLETIPGFRTQLPLPEFLAVTRECGFAMAGQTPTLVPADRILYALRDHTGTVESPYLITASIMSKKLAAGLQALVLDVKTGTGAFMSRDEDARLLARLMVETGELAGTRTVAVLTSMDQPLGRFSGNWLEVWECVDILQGSRHPMSADLIALTNTLAGWMLFLGGKAASPEAGATLSGSLLADGSAWKHFSQMVKHQSSSPEDAARALADPAAFHQSRASLTINSEVSGFLSITDCTEIGWAVQRLGAGRTRPGDLVSAHAGIAMHAKLGDRIALGQPLVTLYSEDAGLLDEPAAMLRETLQITAAAPSINPLIREVVNSSTATMATHVF
jgi:pyrimidine-nucleoside phosphorylase